MAYEPSENGGGMRAGTRERRAVLYTELRELIEQDYPAITLDDAARRLAASRRQLQRVVAEMGQTTFRDLVTEARMRNARAMLADGETVRDVARAVGFDQAADFSKAFRRVNGVPPSALRRAARNGR